MVDTSHRSLIVSINPTRGISTLRLLHLQLPKEALHVSIHHLSSKKSYNIRNTKCGTHSFILAHLGQIYVLAYAQLLRQSKISTPTLRSPD